MSSTSHLYIRPLKPSGGTQVFVGSVFLPFTTEITSGHTLGRYEGRRLDIDDQTLSLPTTDFQTEKTLYKLAPNKKLQYTIVERKSLEKEISIDANGTKTIQVSIFKKTPQGSVDKEYENYTYNVSNSGTMIIETKLRHKNSFSINDYSDNNVILEVSRYLDENSGVYHNNNEAINDGLYALIFSSQNALIVR